MHPANSNTTPCRSLDTHCPSNPTSEYFSFGYKAMCRFWYSRAWSYLAEYAWVLRIDDDCDLAASQWPHHPGSPVVPVVYQGMDAPVVTVDMTKLFRIDQHTDSAVWDNKKKVWLHGRRGSWNRCGTQQNHPLPSSLAVARALCIARGSCLGFLFARACLRFLLTHALISHAYFPASRAAPTQTSCWWTWGGREGPSRSGGLIKSKPRAASFAIDGVTFRCGGPQSLPWNYQDARWQDGGTRTERTTASARATRLGQQRATARRASSSLATWFASHHCVHRRRVQPPQLPH
jgi:hypothetical protein